MSNSDAHFKIALVHDEAYSSFEDKSSNVADWNLEQHMDVVLSGDIQAYERHSIKTQHGEAWFLSTGTGGLNLESGEIPTAVASSVKIVKEHGALFMQIHSEGVDFQYKNTDGEIRDSFKLTR